jgi:hypothetical protein
MTEEEKNILDFVTKKITRNDLLTRLHLDESELDNFISASLEKGYADKNSDDIEYAFYVGFGFDLLYSHELLDILCKLITEDWHISHEDIAMILQRLRSPESVDCLVNAISIANQLEYLEYNEGESFIIKCTWALGDINTEYANQKLNELSLSTNSRIRKAAMFQWERRK